ncbi:52 kDa repressor of the inhibitor of the protein kinase-like [Saccoglossus kowalevskii]|uniref:52 kDa repressor of the inhibitor of the protein kinase-like n=1 Tax=Saccoglossus kowalevskii TaxID=10224 RepID=A0ABM0LYB7_SACKO|nr:PREDICTED: 52 kDa repressor of the inhibitor of the protein kinase-like [Saccoglossus kowalevskii]
MFVVNPFQEVKHDGEPVLAGESNASTSSDVITGIRNEKLSDTNIGDLINATLTTTEIDNVISSLSPGEKYSYIKHHFVPVCYQFPCTYMNGCNSSNIAIQRRLENRRILKMIVKTIVFCGRQCIALRGDHEGITTAGNPGNFLGLLCLIAEQDTLLKKHIDSPRDKRGHYLSPQIQNELISVIGSLILNDLQNEIRESKFYAIMADEATSHNTEQLSLCLRFVDKEKNVREEFVDFMHVHSVTGDAIARAILNSLAEKKLDVSGIRAQTYDGATAMASENVGVQKKIRDVSPLAMYSHCAGHCLNLVIVRSCKVVLKGIVHFHISITVFMVYAFEVIAHGLHRDDGYDLTDGKWSAKSKQDASGLLAVMTNFDFIVSFVTVYCILFHLDGISKKLQSTSKDIFEAYELVTEVKQTYSDVRENIEFHFRKCYDQAVRFADKIGVTPTTPRVARRQTQRPNAPASSPEDYYRLNLAIPFLDHICTELNEQFTGLSAKYSQLIGLVPSVLLDNSVQPLFENIIETYAGDLPSAALFEHELYRWKRHLQHKFSVNDLPPKCCFSTETATIPVTSCECERSFSALRRLNTYNRSCMGQERLTSLALLHIHYDKEIDIDCVVDTFAKLHPRRMGLQSVL